MMQSLYRKKYMKKYHRKWYLKNKKKLNKRNRDYYQSHKEQILNKCKEYVIEHKEKIALYQKQYRIKNKKKLNVQSCVRREIRLHNDLNYRIKYNLHVRLYKALKRNSKRGKTIEMLGCSIDNLKQYLENKFKSGMSWSNYGKWHIDHIRPCASFDLTKESEQRKCFHYTNLQPLWAEENVLKGIKNEY